MDGLILVNKPQNLTSHDVVQTIREIFSIKKVGHFGTLDPLATGILIIAVGKATRWFPYYSKLEKIYKGQIKLGFSTDTYDSTGKITSPEIKKYPEEYKLKETMKSFEGLIQQVPPSFSAKKFKGKSLYKFARQNIKIKLPPVELFIHFFQLDNYQPPILDFRVQCSSGTYIRALANDLGKILGCGAHLSQLSRTEIERFKLEDCFTLKKIQKLYEEKKISTCLIPMDDLLPQFLKLVLNESGAILVKNGNCVMPENIDGIFPEKFSSNSSFNDTDKIFRLFNQDGKLLALARKNSEGKGLHPFLVL